MSSSNNKFKSYICKNYVYIFYFLAFLIPFFIYLSTMNPSSQGWDTTWFHIQVPLLYVGQPTGFPAAFLMGKLFTYFPAGTVAFRLNLFSVLFGALTIFVLFLFIKNLLKNEYYIALVSAVFFSLFKVFWFQTNRFEVYTLNTFFTAIIMLTGLYWSRSKSNKFLYLYYFLIGLSLTNHPISVFLAPAFIFFPVYTEWRQVFRIKKFFILLGVLIAPILLYFYIPIRSWQGYGAVRTFSEFLYYIQGAEWRAQFGFKSFGVTKNVFLEYVDLIRIDFTIIVLVIFLAGIVFLGIYRRKFFYLILSLILLNLIPILMYEQEASHFYLTSIIVFLCVPFACGLYWIKEGIVIFFNRFLKVPLSKKIVFLRTSGKEKVDISGKNNVRHSTDKKQTDRRFVIFRSVFLLVFFIIISFFPINLFIKNYSEMDVSGDTYVYDFWKNILDESGKDSIILSNSLTAHVPIYIDRFETRKNIEIIRNIDLDDIHNIVKENIDNKEIYYTDANLPDLTQYYDVDLVADFEMRDFEETFSVFEIKSIGVDTSITTETDNIEIGFGKKEKISYYIENRSGSILNVSSFELELPELLKLIEMDAESDMESPPGMAQGIYMWTAGPYQIEPGQKYELSFIVQAGAMGENAIKFRLTTGNMYIEGPGIDVKVR